MKAKQEKHEELCECGHRHLGGRHWLGGKLFTNVCSRVDCSCIAYRAKQNGTRDGEGK